MIKFFQTVIGLKSISRKGWKEKVNILNPESVADHSYSMSTIAMSLSDSLNLNTEKVLKMSLLHDLTESITGDLTPNEISKQKKVELENKTMSKILSYLPTNLAYNYNKIWQEYQSQLTKESVLVHETDRLEMALQAKLYQKKGYPPDLLKEFFESAKIGINHTALKKILNKISSEK